MTIVLPAEAKALAEDIKSRCGCYSISDAIRKAVYFLALYLKERDAGNKLVVVEPDGMSRQLEILFK